MAEEVVDIGGGGGGGLTRAGKNELRHYIVSGFVKRDQKQKKKGHSQLTIAAHLTSYTFIADKLYNNPYTLL